jgi:hypothetical protein
MSLFEELSAERKALQADGDLPQWFTTLGWQAFKSKYLYDAKTYEEQIDRVVNNVGRHCKTDIEYYQTLERAFDGWTCLLSYSSIS